MSGDARFVLVLLCFFLSGFAALLYETAWAREFAFVFGTSELAVVAVLAAYMAGLASGAAAAARFVHRVRRPVLVYGLLELGIAISALAVPWAIRATRWLQVAAFGGLESLPDQASATGGLFYLVCSFVILAVPTGLMGATLPLLARHAVRREQEIGSRIGTLYATNTAGAIVGTVAAGFVLLPLIGLRNTVTFGAATNAVVFAGAALLARRAAPLQPDTAPVATGSTPRFHWVLPVVALSGVTSFTYEVVWMRLIGHVVGGSIQGFATMLASFLYGIAAGSAVAARLARDKQRAGLGLAVAQIGAAGLSMAAFASADGLSELALEMSGGRTGSHATNALICALGLLPGALCIGAVYPFAVRLLARDEKGAAPASARAYAWNTVGAITGALLSGLVLLPALGFAGTMQAAAGLNLMLALAAAYLVRPPLRVVAGIASLAVVWVALVPPPTPWSILRFSGTGDRPGEVVFHAVGRSSTVLLLDQGNRWRLATNGLSEALIHRVGPPPVHNVVANWLGLLPVLLRPSASSMLLVGLGGATALEAAPPSLETIDVVELEEEVVEVHRTLAGVRYIDPLADPRVRIRINDARGALLLTSAHFDAIVSQPSHPWTAGASHLYTREFFELVRDHLTEDGVFVQWIGLAFVDESLFRSLLATLSDVFPHVSVFEPGGAVLFAASRQPLDPLVSAPRAIQEQPEHFGRFGIHVAEDLAVAWLLDTDGVRAVGEGAALNTDDRNQLAARSGNLGKRRLRAGGARALSEPHDPLARPHAELDRPRLVRWLADGGRHRRAVQVAMQLEEPSEQEVGLGWALHQRQAERAAGHFRRALELDPSAASAGFGLLSMNRRNASQADSQATGLSAAEAAVVAGWQASSRRDWDALRELEPDLAKAAPTEASFHDAMRMRIRWRIVSSDPAERAQAVDLVRELLEWNPGSADLLVCARALLVAGRPLEALNTLEFLSYLREAAAGSRLVIREAVALLDRMPAEAVPAAGVAAVRTQLLQKKRR